MTISPFVVFISALFVLIFGISLGLCSAIISAKKEEKQESFDELTDIYILQAIIKLYNQDNLYLESDSAEIKDLFGKFQKVKHRLSVDEINSLVKILYFIENDEEDS